MTLRLIHTSDWQIGKVFRFVDNATMGLLQEARLRAITCLGELAGQHDARYILVAGDVYDMEALSPRSLNQPLATGWTECVALLRRSEADVIGALNSLRGRLPVPLLGLDTDNGSEFINYEMLRYCQREQITFTRSRVNRKNDQAFVEEKNGSIVRRLIGYDRYEGLGARRELIQLYEILRLYVNLNAALWGAWLRSGVIGVCLFLGILAGSWGLTRWYANQIQSLIETRGALEFEIQEARQTIERIDQTTWGVKLVEVNGQRFSILPESTPENPLLSMDGRPTVRLSSE